MCKKFEVSYFPVLFQLIWDSLAQQFDVVFSGIEREREFKIFHSKTVRLFYFLPRSTMIFQ